MSRSDPVVEVLKVLCARLNEIMAEGTSVDTNANQSTGETGLINSLSRLFKRQPEGVNQIESERILKLEKVLERIKQNPQIVNGNSLMKILGFKSANFQWMLSQIKGHSLSILKRNVVGTLSSEAIISASNILSTYGSGGLHSDIPTSFKDGSFIKHWNYYYSKSAPGFDSRRLQP